MGKEKEEVKLLREINEKLGKLITAPKVETSGYLDTPTVEQKPSTTLPNALANPQQTAPVQQVTPQQAVEQNSQAVASQIAGIAQQGGFGVAQGAGAVQGQIQAQAPAVQQVAPQQPVAPTAEITTLIANLWVDSQERNGTFLQGADTTALRGAVAQHMASNGYILDQTVSQYLISTPAQGAAYTRDNLNVAQVDALLKMHHTQLSGVVFNGFQGICNQQQFVAQSQ